MPKIDRQAIYERDGGICGFCGQGVSFELMHLDHIVPRGLGGPTTVENLRVAHRQCNISAGRRVVREIQRRARLGLSTTLVEWQTRTVPLPAEILEQVKTLAATETRSVNGEIVQLLKEALTARSR